MNESEHGCWDCCFAECIGSGDFMCMDVDADQDETLRRGLVACEWDFVGEMPCDGKGWRMES